MGLAKVNAIDFIGIEEGHYTTKTWVREVNERIHITMLDELSKKNLFMGRLHYHEAGNRMELILSPREGMTIVNDMLVQMMGWEGLDYEIFNGTGRKMHTMLPYSCQFEANSEQMMVYTDIIAFSTVGSENMPLLHTVHLEAGGKPCHRQFNEIQYHRL